MSELHWSLPYDLLDVSIRVMHPHGAFGNEGLALWLGGGDDTLVRITHVIEVHGPGFRTTPHFMSLSLRAMARLTDLADHHHVFLVGQIHSHPGRFIDLSELDEVHGIRVPNYLSIVCPFYAQRAVVGIVECGVHLFEHSQYRRLSEVEMTRRITTGAAPTTHLRCEVPA